MNFSHSLITPSNHPLVEFYTPEDLRQIKKATEMKDLAPIGLRVLKRMKKAFPDQDIIQISGPISTGGAGSKEVNFVNYTLAVAFFTSLGFPVFNQTPFEFYAIDRIASAWPKESGYCTPILDDYYLPLFESGLIGAFMFMPNWESSTGSKWEHGQAKRLKLKRIYLPHDWVIEYAFRKYLKNRRK